MQAMHDMAPAVPHIVRHRHFANQLVHHQLVPAVNEIPALAQLQRFKSVSVGQAR